MHVFRTAHPGDWLKFSQKVFCKGKADLEFAKLFNALHVIPLSSLLPLDVTCISGNSIPRLHRHQPDWDAKVGMECWDGCGVGGAGEKPSVALVVTKKHLEAVVVENRRLM
jgi:hypothetical protein